MNYPIPTEVNCFIEITLPSDITVPSGSLKYYGTGLFNNDGVATAPFTLSNGYVSNTGNVFKIQACKNANSIQVTGTDGPTGTFTIENIRVPSQVKTTADITIKSY